MSSALRFRRRPSVRLIRQAEATECGLACIAMIAGYHGRQTSLAALRSRFSLSLNGSTLKTLIHIAAALGMEARPLRLNLDAVAKLALPCILHWRMTHFVVLATQGREGMVIYDPAAGRRPVSPTELSEHFTGIALELKPTQQFERRDDRQPLRLTDLWSRITGLQRILLQTLLLSFLIQLFTLAAPFYLQLVVDDVLTKFDTSLLLVLAMGFGLLMLLQELATALRSFVILHLGSMLEFQVVSNLFRHLLRLPLQWYEKRHVGDILSRFLSTQPIRKMVAEGLVATLIDGLMATTTLVLMFVYSPLLGFVVTLAVACYLTLRMALYRPIRDRSENQIAARAEEQSTLIESIRGIQSIKTCGREVERHAHWQNKLADAVHNSLQLGSVRIAFSSANGVLFGVENTIVVYLGAVAVVEGSLTIGMLIAFMSYKQQVINSSVLLIERLIDFRLLSMHLERISDIALAEQEAGLDSTRTDAGPVNRYCSNGSAENGAIELRHVTFRYSDTEAPVLRDVCVSIHSGELVVIVGASGSGKTTLMKLLLGLCTPQEGSVFYCGQLLQEFGLARYRQAVGTVMQNDALLSGSIADNIAFFDFEPDLRKVENCAKQAAVHSDIANMPMGFDSLVGDMGSALSAGQRQRVLLARALYRDPQMLFLDEGTENLDEITEKSIVRTISTLNIIRICVAHRHQVTRAADRVLLLNDGTLHELDKQRFLHARQTVGAI